MGVWEPRGWEAYFGYLFNIGQEQISLHCVYTSSCFVEETALQNAGIPLDRGSHSLGMPGSSHGWSLSDLDSLGHTDDHPPQGGMIEPLQGSASQGG